MLRCLRCGWLVLLVVLGGADAAQAQSTCDRACLRAMLDQPYDGNWPLPATIAPAPAPPRQ